MDLSPDKIWTPKEWEAHANNLLRERYTSADYIPIPDQHNGDGGIEGFSMDGHAYQMYCSENTTTMSKLYEDQRDKMTQDIGKFIKNTNKMKGFFGNLKIKRWILVVPKHKTKEIVIHATKKTEEVKKANLDYVDNDNFRVLVWDREEFKKEEESLLAAGIATLKLDPINVPEHEVVEFQEQSPEFSEHMKRKLGNLTSNANAIKRGQDRLTKYAIISQNMMSELKQDYGEYYEQIASITAKRAEQLDIEAIDSNPETQKISYQTKILQEQLQSSCKLHNDNLETISNGTVADWLMNCTLGFE
ncbi:hypothetical protein ACJJIR_15415 [Microbulbifer sp. SSSA008]|uniref:hypothetical protein n=1 Tax=Microbulbifer sp. SSSA008 TaxID=3243380 RepID=UPI00403982E2